MELWNVGVDVQMEQNYLSDGRGRLSSRRTYFHTDRQQLVCTIAPKESESDDPEECATANM